MTKVKNSSLAKDVILLLLSFYTLMNLLSAIGTLMEGSRLKEILETIYLENAMIHMMTGKAVQHELQGHDLVNQCLTNQILSKITESEQKFLSLIEELEQLYIPADSGDIDINSLLAFDYMERISHAVASKESNCLTIQKQANCV